MLHFLDHRNNIKINGWGVGGGYFILVDKLQGNLKDLIGSWKKVTRLVEQHKVAMVVADVTTFLHERVILFRDLKPANISFNEEGAMKLFDLGMAVELDSYKILNIDMKLVLYATSWPWKCTMLLLLLLAMAMMYVLMSTPSAYFHGRSTLSRYDTARSQRKPLSGKCSARVSVLQWKKVGHRKSRDCWKRVGQKIRKRGQLWKTARGGGAPERSCECQSPSLE